MNRDPADMSKLIPIHLYVELTGEGRQLCPKCKAQDCEGGNITVENGIATQPMSCSCGFTWNDIYKLIRYDP